MSDCALTTSDNPFDPFKNFDQWYQYDIAKGYHTCSYLARISNTSDNLSDSLNEEEIENAIDEIVQLNLLGIITEHKINYEKVINSS